MTDPFTTLFDALVTALADTEIPNLVPARNLISFVDEGDFKENISDADTPEIVLMPLGGDGNPHHSSCSSRVTRQYGFYVATGDKRTRSELFPIEWELFRALCKWQRSITQLTWNGKSYVKSLNLVTHAQAIADPARNRQIRGWSASWVFEVLMIFTTSDVIGD